MGHKLNYPIKCSDLANNLELKWHGSDIDILYIKSLKESNDNSLSYANNLGETTFEEKNVLISLHNTKVNNGAVIESTNPRLSFAKALAFLDYNIGFTKSDIAPIIGKNSIISSSSIIGKDVIIGERTVIENNVVIANGVRIGDDCFIKSNTVIGEAGFGFERDSDGIPIRMLHLGSVIIGNRVEIGSLTTVCRGTLTNTIIEDDVKIDDHVHIAHNCIIKKATLITACVELSGGVEIGEFSWIGPNTSIIQKVKIGSHVFIGIAANVIKNVDDGVTVAGNPARILKKN